MRSVALGLLAVVFAASATRGASIGIFSDRGCLSCNATLTAGQPDTLFILGDTDAESWWGAEFRILGMPAAWSVTGILCPSGNVVAGAPLDSTGVGIAFSSAQGGECVLLCGIVILPATQEANLTLQITETPASVLGCPEVLLDCGDACDTRVCVEGGRMLVNSSHDCRSPVQAATWSSVKRLYE